MKKIIFVIFVLLITAATRAQGQVDWQWSAKRISDKLYEVRLVAKVDDSWHIYSQKSPKGGPLPTNITFTKNPLLQLQGKPKEEGHMEIYHEEVFGVDVYAYSEKVEFVQIVKLKAPVKTNIQGSLKYMACTREQCLAPTTYRFNVALN
jgi:thiol:disulfide interchange protein DsbD